MNADLIVVGSGPAGIGAALGASRAGLAVLLLDEQHGAGGQVYRPRPLGFAPPADPDPDHAIDVQLNNALTVSTVEMRFARKVWFAGPAADGFELRAVGPYAAETLFASRLVAATGTTERIVPFRGWTTPGVMGLAATTIMLKAQRLLPGANVVVAGVGPLLAAVAVGILKHGGRVAAVVDLAGPRDWAATLPKLAARTDLLKRGLGWVAKIRRAGVPILSRHAVVGVAGGEQVTAVQVAAVDASGRPNGAPRTIAADSLAIGHGLVPATEMPRVLGAAVEYDAARGGWVTRADEYGATSVPGLYVAGDGAGVAGAAAALERGWLAGLAAARDSGKLAAERFAAEAAPHRLAARRAARFGGAMARMMAIRPGLVAAIEPDTVVCRCEDVTRAEIDAAIQAGARDVNQLKSWTRCGMGPCQARICGDVVGELIAPAVGGRVAAGLNTARPPLRTLPYRALTGPFDYEDLNLPEPAPS